MHKFIRPINVKARLVNDTFANFSTKFHENNHLKDPFYKKLSTLCIEHTQVTTADGFKTPYNTDGFYFKYDLHGKCIDKNNKPCIINDLYDTDVIMTVQIIPYDFIDNKTSTRRVGVTVKVKNIKQYKI